MKSFVTRIVKRLADSDGHLDADGIQAIAIIAQSYGLLHELSDCIDGDSVIVHMFDFGERKIQAIKDTRAACKKQGLDVQLKQGKDFVEGTVDLHMPRSAFIELERSGYGVRNIKQGYPE